MTKRMLPVRLPLPAVPKLVTARIALDHTVRACQAYQRHNHDYPDHPPYALPQGWAQIYLRRLRRVVALEERAQLDEVDYR